MAKKDYRDTLKKILEDHPEIAAINIEYKQVERLTIGSALPPVHVTSTASFVDGPTFRTPSGMTPIIPAASPELIKKLKGGATIEDIAILNAPPAKEN